MKSWYYHFKQLFTQEECELIVSVGLTLPRDSAVVKAGHGTVLNKELRRSNVAWMNRNDARFRWIFDRLVLAVLEAKQHCFHLRLDAEPRLSYGAIQFTEYLASEQGTYDWHRDTPLVYEERLPSVRKLSLCVQLSPSSSYEGGQFEMEDQEIKTAFKERGDVIVFPSFAKHRVTPVTAGIRHSLVFWTFGPPLT